MEFNDESESRVAPNVASILTNSPLLNAPVQRKPGASTQRKIENLPEDIRVSKAGDDAGFMRKVYLGQCSVTIHDIELAGFGCAGSCRECTSPRDDEKSKSKGWIRGNTKIDPVLEAKVVNYLKRYGIELKIDSMHYDGTQS